MNNNRRIVSARALNIIAGVVTVVLLVIIIWMDVASQFWKETVILSGVAAGLVTFFFTALFLDSAVARREHRKWYPVTRLALSDLLHTIADDEQSDIGRGRITPRSLPVNIDRTRDNLDLLLLQVVAERDEITTVLARWAQFLASSADVQDLMIHIATLAQSLDDIRDEVVTIETSEGADQLGPETPLTDDEAARLRDEVTSYNVATRKAIDEILRILGKLTDY